MDFIDAAIEKKRVEAEKQDQHVRDLVSRCFLDVIYPVVYEARTRLASNGIKAEADSEISIFPPTNENFAKGAKLQILKGIDRRSGFPLIAGPSLSFATSPPHFTTLRIIMTGEDNKVVFAESCELAEMKESAVRSYIQRFIEDVYK